MRSSIGATKLSSIESRPSSTDPEMRSQPSDLDKHEKVYGTTKSHRGSKCGGRHSRSSHKQSRNKTKSTSPLGREIRKQTTMSPLSSVADGEACGPRSTHQKQKIRNSVSSTSFAKRSSSHNQEVKSARRASFRGGEEKHGKKSVNSKKGRR